MTRADQHSRDGDDRRDTAILWQQDYVSKETLMAGVTLGDARRVIAAAEKKAQEIGQPMNIAVVDDGGNIVAHVRMDNAWIGSIDISMNKAYTSRAFDIATTTSPSIPSPAAVLRHSRL